VEAEVSSELDGEGSFVGDAVGFDVADVVDHEDVGAEKADGDGRDGGHGRDLKGLDEVGSADRDDAEEEDDEELSEASVAVWDGSADVEHRRDDREDANDRDGPAADPDEIESAKGGQEEGHDGPEADLFGRQKSGLGDPNGADSFGGIGTFLEVEEVVGEVRADLDEEGSDEGGEERQGLQNVFAIGNRSAHHDRDRRGGQGS